MIKSTSAVGTTPRPTHWALGVSDDETPPLRQVGDEDVHTISEESSNESETIPLLKIHVRSGSDEQRKETCTFDDLVRPPCWLMISSPLD